jgi:hypothetical protein
VNEIFFGCVYSWQPWKRYNIIIFLHIWVSNWLLFLLWLLQEVEEGEEVKVKVKVTKFSLLL